MSTRITIPHQQARLSTGTDGIIRGTLVSRPDGSAHGHLTVASPNGARRYRAVAGSVGGDEPLSFQLEEISTGAGAVELVTLEFQFSTENSGHITDIILKRLPDEAEIVRATVHYEAEID